MAKDVFAIETLGAPTLPNPISADQPIHWVTDQDRILYDPSMKGFRAVRGGTDEPPSFAIAGPSEKIFFDPRTTKAAIVTCGGLCPGINAVIRALVMQLWYRYSVRQIVGIRFGYQGLTPESQEIPLELTPRLVMDIHEQGGTILGSSRGAPPPSVMADFLERENINILFTIGGDGTMRGGSAIAEEVKRRGLAVSIVGIPKTIDNDIPYVRRTFGFETAVSVACQAVQTAHIESRGFKGGIGLVKLMGRHAGYIAANATLATGHINYCLVPEVNFTLEGRGGLLDRLEQRLRHADHAVIVVAEGAGQHYFASRPRELDASGNVKLGNIGEFMRDRILAHFKEKKIEIALKYIDPSYIIRAAPANPADALFCARLAQNAVHAAMAGKTAMLVGFWHGRITYVPMGALLGKRQTINPNGDLWFNVLETTGQPDDLVGKGE